MGIFSSAASKFKRTVHSKVMSNTPTPLMAISDAIKKAGSDTDIAGTIKGAMGGVGLDTSMFKDTFGFVKGALSDAGVNFDGLKNVYDMMSGDITTLETSDPNNTSTIDELKKKFDLPFETPNSSEYEIPKTEDEMKEMSKGVFDIPEMNIDIKPPSEGQPLDQALSFLKGNDLMAKFTGIEEYDTEKVIEKANVPGISENTITLFSNSEVGGMLTEDVTGVIDDISGEIKNTKEVKLDDGVVEANKANVLSALNFDPVKAGYSSEYSKTTKNFNSYVSSHAGYSEYKKYLNSGDEYDIATSGDQTRDEFKKYIADSAAYEANPEEFLKMSGGKQPVNPNQINIDWLESAFSKNEDFSYMVDGVDIMSKAETGDVSEYISNVNIPNLGGLMTFNMNSTTQVDPIGILDAFSIGSKGRLDVDKSKGHVHTKTSEIGKAFGSHKKHISNEPKMGLDSGAAGEFGNIYFDELTSRLKGAEEGIGKDFGNIAELLLKGPAAKLRK